jgi:hypothetical protein
LSASIGTVSDAHDNAVAESFIGVFNNEAITAELPFRTRPLRTLADVEAITMNHVAWYNNHRLHSLLDLANALRLNRCHVSCPPATMAAAAGDRPLLESRATALRRVPPIGAGKTSRNIAIARALAGFRWVGMTAA